MFVDLKNKNTKIVIIIIKLNICQVMGRAKARPLFFYGSSSLQNRHERSVINVEN